MKTTAQLLVLAVLFAATASAQEVRVLVPITPSLISGAYGSVWQTDLAIANTGASQVTVVGYSPGTCGVPTCYLTPPPIPPSTTIYTGIFGQQCGAISGKLLTVQANDLPNLSFTLRTRDTSRDDRTWGSIIPVVRPDELRSASFSLVDVPVGPTFRAMLRIYGVDASTAPQVRIRYFATRPDVQYPVAQPDGLIFEDVPFFTAPLPEMAGGCPTYTQIPLSDPRLVAAGRIRIEVVPLDGRQTYWAFVSVTNNDTQEVSNILPN